MEFLWLVKLLAFLKWIGKMLSLKNENVNFSRAIANAFKEGCAEIS